MSNNVEKISAKRRRSEIDSDINHVIFIVPVKFTKARLKLLKDISKSKSLQVAELFSDSVTHIVTKLETREKVHQYLEKASLTDVEIVNDSWLTACLTECRLLDVLDKHRVEPHLSRKDHKERISGTYHFPRSNVGHISYQDTNYECQRRTPLYHHNNKYTEALEVLEKHASYSEHGESRALAFRKASCALKAYPREITRTDEVSGIKHIGEHSLRVITEILENGYSKEVQNIITSEMFQVLELFTGIYGCGPSTAHRWYGLGHRTIQDIKDNAELLNLNIQQTYGRRLNHQQWRPIRYPFHLGVKFYDDLNTPVNISDAVGIQNLVLEQLNLIQPGCSAELVGGFCRGKQRGHDVDVLISHPEEDKVEGLLVKLVHRLTALDYMLHTTLSVGKNVDLEVMRVDKGSQKRTTMDNLDRCFAIMKVGKCVDDDDSCNSWVAARVDFIIAPFSQYSFALLGWIGSKQFNRSLRLYAWKEMKIHLNSHGMWDHKLMPPKRIIATTEEEIFKALRLDFVEPKDRNC